MIYIFRREDWQAVRNLNRLIGIASKDSHRYRLTVIDKSSLGLDQHLADLASDTDVEVVRRPREETQFASLGRVPVELDEWVLQFHEDDDWVGMPDVPYLGNVTTSHWVNTRIASTEHIASSSDASIALPNIFFGLVNPAVWNAFVSVCNAYSEPSPGLDQVLVTWCAQLGLEGPVSDYAYLYDNSHWADIQTAQSVDRELAESIGWESHAGTEALQFTIWVDKVASLAQFHPLISPEDRRRILEDFLVAFPPFGASGRMRRLLRMTPGRLRGAITRTRGKGRGWNRAVSVLGKSRVNRRSAVDRLLVEGISVRSISDLEQILRTNLLRCGLPRIEIRTGEWLNQLASVRALDE